MGDDSGAQTKKRGRPKKNVPSSSSAPAEEFATSPKKRGRPPKSLEANTLRKVNIKVPGRKRGRPPKKTESTENIVKNESEAAAVPES
jgi:hypothetical protein